MHITVKFTKTQIQFKLPVNSDRNFYWAVWKSFHLFYSVFGATFAYIFARVGLCVMTTACREVKVKVTDQGQSQGWSKDRNAVGLTSILDSWSRAVRFQAIW